MVKSAFYTDLLAVLKAVKDMLTLVVSKLLACNNADASNAAMANFFILSPLVGFWLEALGVYYSIAQKALHLP